MLSRRLKPSHPSYPLIQEALAIELAGWKGEKELDYPLSHLTNEYLILHNVRINDGTHFFQNDCIILTRKWILLIEAKNIAGQLFYDQTKDQLIRTTETGMKEGFNNPVTQVLRHKRQLQKWLSNNHLPDTLPIHCLVSNSHPRCVSSFDDPMLNIVTRTYSLPEKIETLPHNPNRISSKDLKKLSSSLVKQDTPLKPDFFEQYKIKETDLLPGVYCDHCHSLSIYKKYNRWECATCKKVDKEAHVQALKDYVLIYGSLINNAKLRRFLNMSCPKAAQRLICSLGLKPSGKTKGRVYHLPFHQKV